MIIKSVADIKRIPVGTRLFLVRSLLGENPPKGRIFKKARSADVIFTVDDPGSKNHDEDSYLTLCGVQVTPTDDGFRITVKETGQVQAEYKFDK